MLLHRNGKMEPLAAGDGLPIGIMSGAEYLAQTMSLAADDRVMIVSDGLVEQHGPVQAADGSTQMAMFELTGVEQAIRQAGEGDEVAAIFDGVVKHAGSSTLADDATAVLVRW